MIAPFRGYFWLGGLDEGELEFETGGEEARLDEAEEVGMGAGTETAEDLDLFFDSVNQ